MLPLPTAHTIPDNNYPASTSFASTEARLCKPSSTTATATPKSPCSSAPSAPSPSPVASRLPPWPHDHPHQHPRRAHGLIPATNDRHRLTSLHAAHHFVVAVVCTIDGCDHLDCDCGPFTVVLVAEDNVIGMLMRAILYSSETRSWSESVSVLYAGAPHRYIIDRIKPILLAVARCISLLIHGAYAPAVHSRWHADCLEALP